jgi:hypothetical protein
MRSFCSKFSPKKIGGSLSPKKELEAIEIEDGGDRVVERFARVLCILEPLGLGSRGEQTSKNW